MVLARYTWIERGLISEFTVLSTIQDKVNNPSPDDPFEPEIAAVSAALLSWA